MDRQMWVRIQLEARIALLEAVVRDRDQTIGILCDSLARSRQSVEEPGLRAGQVGTALAKRGS